MATKMETIKLKVKEACKKRGVTGPAKLKRTFKVFNDVRDKSIEFCEFEKGLKDYGTGLTSEEAKLFFDELDKDKSGKLDIDEFLNMLREPLSNECLEVVKQVFAKMDATGDGVIKSEDMRKLWKTDDSANFDAYLKRFDSGDSGAGPVEVTMDEFIEYYTSQRFTNYNNDERFINSLKSCWGL